MCNYCGCRDTPAIAALTADHEQLLELRGQLKSAVHASSPLRAARSLRELCAVLARHDAAEEAGLYPMLALVDGYSAAVEKMYDEHDDVDLVLSAARTVLDRDGPSAVDWAAVCRALDALGRHIDAEEHGLFPAAAVSLDAAAWQRIDTACRCHS